MYSPCFTLPPSPLPPGTRLTDLEESTDLEELSDLEVDLSWMRWWPRRLVSSSPLLCVLMMELGHWEEGRSKITQRQLLEVFHMFVVNGILKRKN